MAGLRRTGQFLVMAMIPGLLTGCASTGSRLAVFQGSASKTEDQNWARAQLYEKEGRLAEAQQLYVQLYKSNPETARYAHRLGVVSTILGDRDRAEMAYRRANQLDPQNAELLADMGYAAYLQQNYRDAESLLRQSLAVVPENPRAKSNLALTVGFQGRDEECLALFQEIHGQDQVEILCNLAYIKSQRGDNEAAAQLYQQVVAIDPTVTKATVALSQLKPQKPAGQNIAQQKSYRKFMNDNAPKPQQPRTKPAEAEVAQSAGVATGPEKVTLTSRTDEPGDTAPVKQPAREELTGWEEAETDLQTVEQQPARSFPVETTKPVVTRPAPVMTSPQARVAAEEMPITVVEEAAEHAPRAIPDDLSTAFEVPEQLVDGWTATKTGLPDRFSPEWLKSRMEQLAARSGQTGFMGFCPVMLREELRLVDISPEFTVEYQSQKYQFSSEEAAGKFTADPERYLPAAGGLDVVAVSQGTAVAQGSLEHALWFRNKLYLFLNQENLTIFRTQARQFAVQQ